MTLRRKLLGIALVLAAAGPACSIGRSAPPPPPPAPAPAAEEPASAEETSNTTTTEPSLVFAVPEPAPPAEVADPFENPDLAEPPLFEPLEETDELPTADGEPAGASDQSEAADLEPSEAPEQSGGPNAGAIVDVVPMPAAADDEFDARAEDVALSLRRFERASDPGTPADQLALLAADSDAAVRRAAAGNPATPPESLAALVGDVDPVVGWLAAANRSNWPESRVFPTDPEYPDGRLDRLDVADNPAPWSEILRILTADAASRQRAAADPRTSPAALLALAGDPRENDVRVWVAANPSAPPEALALLARSDDPVTRRAVSENTGHAASGPCSTRRRFRARRAAGSRP